MVENCPLSVFILPVTVTISLTNVLNKWFLSENHINDYTLLSVYIAIRLLTHLFIIRLIQIHALDVIH